MESSLYSEIEKILEYVASKGSYSDADIKNVLFAVETFK